MVDHRWRLGGQHLGSIGLCLRLDSGSALAALAFVNPLLLVGEIGRCAAFLSAALCPHRVVATAPEIPQSFTFAFSVDTWSLLSQVTTEKASVALWGGAVGLA